MKPYRHLILGGTFDRFHIGHELFLKTAFDSSSSRITIGITTPPLFRNKPLAETIESYDDREKNVKKFVAKINQKHITVNYIPIDGIYGTSLTDVTIDGIVVTPETQGGASAINRKREEAGMKPLDIIKVPLVLAGDGVPVSSFRIRYGDIDRKGTPYRGFFAGTRSLILPDGVRPRLREPVGDLFPGTLSEHRQVVNRIMESIRTFSPKFVFTIGDIIFQTMAENGFCPGVAVIDHKSRRQALSDEISIGKDAAREAKFRNRPGTIQYEAVAALVAVRDRFFKTGEPQRLVIDGEEDLLALPAILFAPLGSVVLYGQYDAGAVLVRVTEEKKNEVFALLHQFTR